MLSTTSKRVLAYVLLALLFYGIAVGLGGVGLGAMLFVAGGLLFEGFLWMEARRAWKRRQGDSR
jgi:hypothetical protein